MGEVDPYLRTCRQSQLQQRCITVCSKRVQYCSSARISLIDVPAFAEQFR